MIVKESRRYQASLSYLDEMIKWIRQYLIESGLPAKRVNQLSIAIEEVLVNIINYAYREPPGPVEISLSKLPEERAFRITFKDQGIPFDPLKEEYQPDLTGTLDERKLGGLGIYLVRQLVDHVTYKREQGSNLLTMTLSL